MKDALTILLQDRPVWIGTLGTFSTVLLENIHLLVGIAVGLTTIVYLLLKIRKEIRTQRGSGETETTEKAPRVRKTVPNGSPRERRRP